MSKLEIKGRINATIEQLTTEELTFVENLLNKVTSYFKNKHFQDNSLKNNYENNDPLAELRNSDFIGCFSDESDLAEKSEKIVHDIISKKG